MEKMVIQNITQFTDTPYMNKDQIAYFKNKLIQQKMELQEKMTQLRKKLTNMKANQPDILDQSNYLMEMEKEIHAQERYSIRLRQIHRALDRIETGGFGYCEYTGDEIGLRRLEILPFTTVCVHAMEEFAS